MGNRFSIFNSICWVSILWSISPVVLNANDEPKSGQVIVQAKNGLILRTEASKNSKRIAKLKNGTKVKLVAIDKKEVLYGINAYWVKIQAKGKVGFVYSGFLKFPEINKRISSPNGELYLVLLDFSVSGARCDKEYEDLECTTGIFNKETGKLVAQFHGTHGVGWFGNEYFKSKQEIADGLSGSYIISSINMKTGLKQLVWSSLYGTELDEKGETAISFSEDLCVKTGCLVFYHDLKTKQLIVNKKDGVQILKAKTTKFQTEYSIQYHIFSIDNKKYRYDGQKLQIIQ